MSPLATITGTMLTPGVSRNNRLYTKELIGSAVERMQTRIADPNALPVVMRTHHNAGDNTRAIVGRVTGVDVDEAGTARYTATLYDTAAGRDLLAQIGGKDPAFRNTSIYGYWDGQVRQVEHDGQTVETGDSLDVEAIDFTAFPGVPTARVDSVRTGSPRESTLGRHVVTESLEPPVVEADFKANTKPPGAKASDYADPGYQKDGKKRYLLDTAKRVRAAWSYINQADNREPYTTDQLEKIEGRIKAAAKKFGIQISDDSKESAVPDAPIGETTLGEVTEFFGDEGNAGFCIDAYNGPLCITLRAPCIDPSGLRAVATAAMNAALDALQAMDPDMDADIDVPGAPDADTDMGEQIDDDDMETVEHDQPQPDKESALPPVTITPRELAGILKRRAAGESKPVPVTVTQLGEPHADHTPEPQTPSTDQAGDNHTMEEAVVADTSTQAVETAAPDTDTKPTEATEQAQPARTLTDEDLKAFATVIGATVGETLKQVLPQQTPATEAAPNPKPATETHTSEDTPAAVETAPQTDTAEAIKASMKATVDEAIKNAIPQILDTYGLPRRKGFRTTAETEQEMTREELWNSRGDILLGDFGKPA